MDTTQAVKIHGQEKILQDPFLGVETQILVLLWLSFLSQLEFPCSIQEHSFGEFQVFSHGKEWEVAGAVCCLNVPGIEFETIPEPLWENRAWE